MTRKPKAKPKAPVCKPHCWLVDDWRRMWKWLSVQIMALIVAAQGLLEFMPSVKEYISPSLWHGAMAFLAALAIIARIVNQSKP